MGRRRNGKRGRYEIRKGEMLGYISNDGKIHWDKNKYVLNKRISKEEKC